MIPVRFHKAKKREVLHCKAEAVTDCLFVTSVPYQKGMRVFVDGSPAEPELVNTAFLGCRIGRGEHEIQIIYHAPGVRAGKVMSLAGLLFIGLCIYYGKKKLPI